MTRFQSGVIAEANADALFITLNINRSPESADCLRQVLAEVPATEQGFRQRYPDADMHITVAIGSEYWDQLSPQQRPAQLRAFPALSNDGISMPHTPVDLLLHIRSERHDLNYEVAALFSEKLTGHAELAEEVHCFRYLDSRDLTGFVDGTENPEGDHRAEVALVGEEDSVFAGGSYIHLQRYEHDLKAWNQIPLQQQEDILGRTKADNREYASADKAAFAHTKRASLKGSEGRSIEILRHSMPYGNLTRRGLMFAAYCRSAEPFTKILESMVLGDGSGHHDHLMNFTTAVTGQAFFAPSSAWLEKLI
ncbi:putative iron-dependent peroxidase [Amphritea atlantica]|uniref:Putative iron-dependent peroxidase n=1 Tax=Amphritea atlantica TaxID=355243 RepID=A0A1H9KIP8_9GAMM|nr:Dyp-type peroxidase [Amphritea atlantica]SEQ99044.1 putative iron-dependent peroxidase [Amphritea atlantica]